MTELELARVRTFVASARQRNVTRVSVHRTERGARVALTCELAIDECAAEDIARELDADATDRGQLTHYDLVTSDERVCHATGRPESVAAEIVRHIPDDAGGSVDRAAVALAVGHAKAGAASMASSLAAWRSIDQAKDRYIARLERRLEKYEDRALTEDARRIQLSATLEDLISQRAERERADFEAYQRAERSNRAWGVALKLGNQVAMHALGSFVGADKGGPLSPREKMFLGMVGSIWVDESRRTKLLELLGEDGEVLAQLLNQMLDQESA